MKFYSDQLKITETQFVILRLSVTISGCLKMIFRMQIDRQTDQTRSKLPFIVNDTCFHDRKSSRFSC